MSPIRTRMSRQVNNTTCFHCRHNTQNTMKTNHGDVITDTSQRLRLPGQRREAEGSSQSSPRSSISSSIWSQLTIGDRGDLDGDGDGLRGLVRIASGLARADAAADGATAEGATAGGAAADADGPAANGAADDDEADADADAESFFFSSCSRSAASRSGLSLCLRCVSTATRGLKNSGTGGFGGRAAAPGGRRRTEAAVSLAGGR
jgi:hypothetical protein